MSEQIIFLEEDQNAEVGEVTETPETVNPVSEAPHSAAAAP